jgi:hypothetical protein
MEDIPEARFDAQDRACAATRFAPLQLVITQEAHLRCSKWVLCEVAVCAKGSPVRRMLDTQFATA